MSFAILQAEDRVGLALFNKGIVKNLPPSSGDKQFYILKKILTNPKNYGGPVNYSRVLTFLMSYLRRGDILIIVSDFIGLKHTWHKHIQMLGRKFDVIGVMKVSLHLLVMFVLFWNIYLGGDVTLVCDGFASRVM